MPTGSFDLKAWARIGAERRLEELKAETQAIYAMFPELRRGAGIRHPGRPRKAESGGGGHLFGPFTKAKSRKRKKKRTMSAEARAKIAAAQRKRWAKRRSG